jgi:hypothetical protein
VKMRPSAHTNHVLNPWVFTSDPLNLDSPVLTEPLYGGENREEIGSKESKSFSFCYTTRQRDRSYQVPHFRLHASFFVLWSTFAHRARIPSRLLHEAFSVLN